MAFQQLHDIPQISVDENGPLSNRMMWRTTEDDLLNDQKIEEWPSRSLCSYPSIKPQPEPRVEPFGMRRFLQNAAQDPFTAELRRADVHRSFESPLYYQQLDFNKPYEDQFPDCYRRQVSPDGTNWSSSSGDWSACHSEELYTSSFNPPYPLKARSQFVHYELSYRVSSHLQTCSPELPQFGGSCALADIQHYPDESLEPSVDETEYTGVKLEHQDHYDGEVIHVRPYEQYEDEDEGLGGSIRDAESVQPLSQDDDDSDYTPGSPTSLTPKRRRRSGSFSATRSPKRCTTARKSSSSSSHPTTSSPANSSPRAAKRKSHTAKKPKTGAIASATSTTPRPFPCPLAPYACPATFTSKNEWKRHVGTQHVKLGFWRCGLCRATPAADAGAPPSYNDFNRKDLFTQHLRRMHGAKGAAAAAAAVGGPGGGKGAGLAEEEIAEMQERCYRRLREPPRRSGCVFCDRVFVGEGSWEERMEHVGRHLEKERRLPARKGVGVEGWREDVVFREWLVGEGLVRGDGRGGWRVV